MFESENATGVVAVAGSRGGCRDGGREKSPMDFIMISVAVEPVQM